MKWLGVLLQQPNDRHQAKHQEYGQTYPLVAHPQDRVALPLFSDEGFPLQAWLISRVDQFRSKLNFDIVCHAKNTSRCLCIKKPKNQKWKREKDHQFERWVLNE